MNWKHGYHAESGYTFGYYAETMPSRLRWAALIQGQSAPEQNFRYLDAGCGQGLNLILAAAAHPDSEFVGLDFMPGHIAHARALARQCGLTNVTFIEADFVQIAEDPSALGALGEFDYAVCHGITTWISPVANSGLFRLIGQTLKPGGLFYNSYNTYPGWLNIVPFQHLVLEEQRHRSGSDALAAARATMEALGTASPNFLKLSPGLDARLNSIKALDSAYLVQEYNNQFWRPVFVTEMIEALAEVKLDYLGTATLAEAFPGVLPEAIRSLIAHQPTQKLQLQVQDYAIHQSFRRDLYVKGKVSLWPEAQKQAILDSRFRINPTAKRPQDGASYKLAAGNLEIGGQAEVYGAVLDQCAVPKGLTLRELRHPRATGTLGDRMQMVSLLLQGGWLVPCIESSAPGASINHALTTAIAEGAPYTFISAPNAGGGIGIGSVEALVLRCVLNERPRNEWLQAVREALKEQGRTLNRDGQAVTDEAVLTGMLTELIDNYQPTLNWLNTMGALRRSTT